MGSAQRLANGNTVITESAFGRIFEVTADGTLWPPTPKPQRRGSFQANPTHCSALTGTRLRSSRGCREPRGRAGAGTDSAAVGRAAPAGDDHRPISSVFLVSHALKLDADMSARLLAAFFLVSAIGTAFQSTGWLRVRARLPFVIFPSDATFHAWIPLL